MNGIFSTGDMAKFQLLQRNTSLVKSDIARHSSELTTGRTAKISEHLNGEVGKLGALEHGLAQVEAYNFAGEIAGQSIRIVQSSLQHIQGVLGDLVPGLLMATSNGAQDVIGPISNDAAGKFSAIVSVLNTQTGGRHVFSGKATDAPPLAPAEELVAELQVQIAGSASASEALPIIENFFLSAGGGFETMAYRGATGDNNAIKIGKYEQISNPARADNMAVRKTLMGVAIGALIDDGLFASSRSDRQQMLHSAAENLLNAQAELSELQGHVGEVEARIEYAQTANQTEKFALLKARSDLIGKDEFESAVALQNAQTRLEALYTLTSRMSRMSLVDYL